MPHHVIIDVVLCTEVNLHRPITLGHRPTVMRRQKFDEDIKHIVRISFEKANLVLVQNDEDVNVF